MLDPKLATFLALCETRSYTQTASVLNVTQPAVSQHMKYLENYYGARLFYYDENRNLHLTEKGKLLRAFALRLRADSELLLERMRGETSEARARLKVGTVTTSGEVLLPRAIAEYIKKYPDKKASLYLGEADHLFLWLQEGRIHCCITDEYCPSALYESKTLFEAETVCVCSPKHPFAGKTVDFGELKNERLIFRENDSHSYRNIRRILQEYNQELDSFRSYLEMGTINAVKNLVMENIGISFIYDFAVRRDLEEGGLSRIFIKSFLSRSTFSFAWMKDSFFAEESKAFYEVCRALTEAGTPAPQRRPCSPLR